jgi:hypothetical protein
VRREAYTSLVSRSVKVTTVAPGIRCSRLDFACLLEAKTLLQLAQA